MPEPLPDAAAAPSERAASAPSVRRGAWIGALLLPFVIGPLWTAGFSQVSFDVPPLFGAWTGMLLVMLAGVATYTDIRWRRIPNWATYSAVAWGFGINLTATLAPEFARNANLGAIGIGGSLLGFVVLFVAPLIVFSFTGGGAGDVKLAAALGALFGVERGVNAVLFAMVAAGVGVLAWSIWSVGLPSMARAVGRRLGNLVLPVWVAAPSEGDAKLLRSLVPLGPFFAIGTMIALCETNLESLFIPLGL